MLGPTRPLLDAGQMLPCLLQRQIHHELSLEHWWPEPVEGKNRDDRHDDSNRSGNEGHDCLWT
jgi:hypothetical protein